MDTETHLDDEYISAPPPDEPVFTLYGSGMFAGSQHFTIAGGTFNNSTYHAAPAAPAGFRMLPMGDIDLQRELIVNTKSGVVESRRERNYVRRVYSARVIGRNSNLTVAVYQGDGAEENWRRDTEMYMSVRHPNIIQTWAGASYGNVHAMVFYGDLVPLSVFLARQSPIMAVYLRVCYAGEWKRVGDYLQSLGTTLYQEDCTMWIRSSTGRLSVDLVFQDTGPAVLLDADTQISTPSDSPNVTEVIAIESLELRQYHRMCYLSLAQFWSGSIPASTTVDIRAVISWSSQHQYEEHVEIAHLTDVDVHPHRWLSSKIQELVQNGWSRYRADDVFDTQIVLGVYLFYVEAWLSQANYIFSRLEIASNLDDYMFLRHINFTLRLGDAGRDPPTGFLFLCPMEEFRTGRTSFRWPKRPAYWSLNPEGLEALSTEEAERLGFPPFQLTMKIGGIFWDANVYAGLCQFHQAKGFNTDSQEVAIYLGQPLFRLSRDANPAFAHVDDWFHERPDEEVVDGNHKDEESSSANHDAHEDGECSLCDLDSNESSTQSKDGRADGQLEVCAQPRRVHQEPTGPNFSSMDQETHTDPHFSNEHTTGGSFIRRFFWRLEQGLVTETDNVDVDLISPFLI